MCVVGQIFFFFSFASFGDFGVYREKILYAATIVCCFLLISRYLVNNPKDYYWGAFNVIFVETMFGLGCVMYNAELPFLIKSHPDVRKLISERKKANEIVEKFDEILSNVGTIGVRFGYIGGLLCLMMCIVLVVFQGSTTLVHCHIFAFVGVWYFIFTIPLFLWMQDRPGAVLKGGTDPITLISFSWKRMLDSLSNLSMLPQHLKFVLAYFMYSDGYSTISKVGVIFAEVQLKMNIIEISLLAIIIPLFAIPGISLTVWYQKKYRLNAMQMVIRELMFLVWFPILGVVGFIDAFPIGVKSKYELYIECAVYGFCLGALENHSRIAFCEFIPPGQESEYFGLMQITDKGSSWIGPLVCAYLWTWLNDVRWGFVYLLFAIGTPIFVLYTVDMKKAKADASSLRVAIAIKTMKKRREINQQGGFLKKFLSIGGSSSLSKSSSVSGSGSFKSSGVSSSGFSSWGFSSKSNASSIVSGAIKSGMSQGMSVQSSVASVMSCTDDIEDYEDSDDIVEAQMTADADDLEDDEEKEIAETFAHARAGKLEVPEEELEMGNGGAEIKPEN